jgi:hypothetical protein
VDHRKFLTESEIFSYFSGRTKILEKVEAFSRFEFFGPRMVKFLDRPAEFGLAGI